MKLVIHDPAWPIYEPALRELCGSDWTISSRSNDVNWLMRELPNTDALIAHELPEEALPLAQNLKLFLYPGAGFVQQRTDELPAGCVLSNVYEHEVPIAEYVMMTILMFLTRIEYFEQLFRVGNWRGTGRIGGEPHDPGPRQDSRSHRLRTHWASDRQKGVFVWHASASGEAKS
jgi:phosphoglycerate dehydrogenase-like enzyme